MYKGNRLIKTAGPLLLAFLLSGCTHIPYLGNKLIKLSLVYPVTKELKVNPAREARIPVAGNEHESFILKIETKESYPLQKLIINLSPTEIQFQPFLIQFTSISPLKRLPDPLVPLNTWEKTVLSPGSTTYILVELYNPPGASREKTKLTITPFPEEDPIRLTIVPRKFDLPRESLLKTAFQCNNYNLRNYLKRNGHSEKESGNLYLNYLRLLGEHKISVQWIEKEKWDTFNPEQFEKNSGAYLDGRLFPELAKPTTLMIPPPAETLKADKDLLINYYRETAEYLATSGRLEKMYFLLRDEPRPEDFTGIKEEIRLIKRASPEIKTLVTHFYTPEFDHTEKVDIWCPDIPSLGDSRTSWRYMKSGDSFWRILAGHAGDWETIPTRPARTYAGKEAWMYTCASAILDSRYPNLFITGTYAHHRVIPWLIYRYGFQGLLYWNTIYSFRKAGVHYDPEKKIWKNIYFDLKITKIHGDGTLLYPGKPEWFPFLKTHTPLPSLRLKALRKGIEDFEYLKLLENAAGPETAEEYSRKILRTSRDWETKQETYLQVKEEIARFLEKNAPGK